MKWFFCLFILVSCSSNEQKQKERNSLLMQQMKIEEKIKEVKEVYNLNDLTDTTKFLLFKKLDSLNLEKNKIDRKLAE